MTNSPAVVERPPCVTADRPAPTSTLPHGPLAQSKARPYGTASTSSSTPKAKVVGTLLLCPSQMSGYASAAFSPAAREIEKGKDARRGERATEDKSQGLHDGQHTAGQSHADQCGADLKGANDRRSDRHQQKGFVPSHQTLPVRVRALVVWWVCNS